MFYIDKNIIRKITPGNPKKPAIKTVVILTGMYILIDNHSAIIFIKNNTINPATLFINNLLIIFIGIDSILNNNITANSITTIDTIPTTVPPPLYINLN